MFAAADPVNNDDPSGAFSLAQSASIGRQVHTLIGKDFLSQVPEGITAQSIFTVLDQPTVASPILDEAKKLAGKLGRIFPDLVATLQRQVFEIKPLSYQETGKGVLQLAAYITALDMIDPSGPGCAVGSPFVYSYPSTHIIVLDNPAAMVFVAPTVLGMIYYKAETLEHFVEDRAENVAEEESADLADDSEGIATLDSEMGAP